MEYNSLLEALEWRYATNIFDDTQIIEEEVLQGILKAGNLTATAFGAQAYQMILLEGKQWREKLESATFNQKNVQTCSHLLVLAHRTDLDPAYIKEHAAYMEQVRGLEEGSLAGYERGFVNFLKALDEDKKNHWLAKQVYIILGNLMTACAIHAVDACPMEGFNAKLVDEILGLEEKKLNSVLMLPMGYRSEQDKYARTEKVRKPLDEMVIRM